MAYGSEGSSDYVYAKLKKKGGTFVERKTTQQGLKEPVSETTPKEENINNGQHHMMRC